MTMTDPLTTSTPSSHPLTTRQAVGIIAGIETTVTLYSFSDKLMITISQDGRLAQWVFSFISTFSMLSSLLPRLLLMSNPILKPPLVYPNQRSRPSDPPTPHPLPPLHFRPTTRLISRLTSAFATSNAEDTTWWVRRLGAGDTSRVSGDEGGEFNPSA